MAYKLHLHDLHGFTNIFPQDGDRNMQIYKDDVKILLSTQKNKHAASYGHMNIIKELFQYIDLHSIQLLFKDWRAMQITHWMKEMSINELFLSFYILVLLGIVFHLLFYSYNGMWA